MAFSNQLATAGFAPDHLHVEAEVAFEKLEGGWTVTSSALQVIGSVPDCPIEEFERLAAAAKDGCPISRALAGNVEISVDASLEDPDTEGA
jgi:osmotically inducible protein OsmC